MAAFASLVCGSEKTKGTVHPGSSLWIKIEDDRIIADIQNMELAEVLKEISRKAKINFTIGEGVRDKISIKFAGITIEEALRRLCENRAIVFEYQPEKLAYRILSAGAYSGQKKKKSEKKKFNKYKQQQKQKTSGQLCVPETKKPGAGSMSKSSKKIYDAKERLLYKPGELLIKFKEDITEKQIVDLHKTMGSKVLRRIDKHRLQQIKLREGLSEAKAVILYQASGLVEIAERHALRYANATVPNDEYFGEQWGLTKIRAPEAWNFTTGSSEIVIAVIDTGVDYFHPDLLDNIWTNADEIPGDGLDNDENGYIDDSYGWDFAGNDETEPGNVDPDPMDVDGHGTHVAGIIAAKGNNNIGIAGVCRDAKIMALKVQTDNDEYMEDVDVIEAIYYAIDNGAKIVNCSFGGEAFVEIEYNAFANLKNAGILAVCAAGNDGINTDVAGNENYPSCYSLENIISVASSDQNDNLASISNYGLTSVDVMAPGESIKSTITASSYTTASIKINGAAYTACGMAYAGTTDAEGTTGILYNCGKGYSAEFPPEVSGNIALIERGKKEGTADFYFFEKTFNAQDAGAIAVIIYNNVIDEFDQNGGTLMTTGDWIPVVNISMADGAYLIGQIENPATPPPSATVVNKLIAYGNKSGTSMATPHVSGIAGLILAINSSLDYAGVKSAILNSVDKIHSVSDEMVAGGRINALAALSSIYMPGDISGDNKVRIDDAILALQVLSGMKPQICAACILCGVDVNGDRRIGMEDAIYIIQKVSELYQ